MKNGPREIVWPKQLGRSAQKLLKRSPGWYRSAHKKFRKLKGGSARLKDFRDFNGVPLPPEFTAFNAPGRNLALTGMGKVPWIEVSNGGRKRRIKGPWHGGFTGPRKSRRIWLLKRAGLPKRSRWKYIGRVALSVYETSDDVSRAGSPKAWTQWRHEHNDERGKWPKAYMDQNGNVKYGRGTYGIKHWIRK